MNAAEGARQKREILDALRKLGETLTPEEETYLKQYTEGGAAGFAKMTDSTGRHVSLHFAFTQFRHRFAVYFQVSMQMLSQRLLRNKLPTLKHHDNKNLAFSHSAKM